MTKKEILKLVISVLIAALIQTKTVESYDGSRKLY